MNKVVMLFVVVGGLMGTWHVWSGRQDRKDAAAEDVVASALCADRSVLASTQSLVADGGRSMTMQGAHALCDKFDNALADQGAKVAQKDRVLGPGGKTRWERIAQLVNERCPTAAGSANQTAFATGALPAVLLMCKADKH